MKTLRQQLAVDRAALARVLGQEKEHVSDCPVCSAAGRRYEKRCDRGWLMAKQVAGLRTSVRLAQWKILQQGKADPLW